MTPLLAVYAPAAILFAAGLVVIRAPLVEKAGLAAVMLCAAALVVGVP